MVGVTVVAPPIGAPAFTFFTIILRNRWDQTRSHLVADEGPAPVQLSALVDTSLWDFLNSSTRKVEFWAPDVQREKGETVGCGVIQQQV